MTEKISDQKEGETEGETQEMKRVAKKITNSNREISAEVVMHKAERKIFVSKKIDKHTFYHWQIDGIVEILKESELDLLWFINMEDERIVIFTE